MLLLDIKDGHFWWKRYNPVVKDYEFISQEENEKLWEDEKRYYEELAARYYNDAFNSGR